MIPASWPGPRIATSSSAQISELIYREPTTANSAPGRRLRADGDVLPARSVDSG